jgi:hypothetical protein
MPAIILGPIVPTTDVPTADRNNNQHDSRSSAGHAGRLRSGIARLAASASIGPPRPTPEAERRVPAPLASWPPDAATRGASQRMRA